MKPGVGRKKKPTAKGGGKKEAPTDTDDLIWGINAVREALETRNLGELAVQKGKGGPRIQEIVGRAREQGVRVRFVESARLGVPSGVRHQGVVGRRSAAVFLSLDRLLDHISREPDEVSRLLILDCIQDPGNVGSILRSALAAGFRYVIVPRERSAPISGTVARTSAGAVAHLQLCRVGNLVEAMKSIKEQGFWVYGAVLSGDASSIYETDFSGKVALVVGSEGKGIRPLVQQHCDHLITIPMQSDFDSLNVSVAAAIIMFEMVRDRQDW
ncbi:MAG TPA: 23S rRNA (guanosine(2251)-2'-O)-methyltransferase RlmB [Desulfobulbaceae bacterium]|nr:23S rRNA (guanosine(2251)-2'-O)-methyltransferase RlmB [Desulfobulbaceae bacterium]